VRRGVAIGLAALTLSSGVTLAYLRLRGPRLPPAPTAQELERLRQERVALQARFSKLTSSTDELDLASAPPGNLLIGVSPGFVRGLVQEVATGLLHNVRLSLRNLKVHHEGEIRASLLFKERKLGDFKLDLSVDRVTGMLHPGTPRLTFGGDRIGITLPVSLTSPGGQATLRWRWTGQGITGAVCGDMDVTRVVTTRVVPATYTIKGAFKLSTFEGAVVAQPEFGTVKIPLLLEPTEEAWAVVEQLVEDQRQLCEIALRKIDVRQQLEGLLGQGISVKLPSKIFRPIRLPATVNQSLDLGGKPVKLTVRPIGLVVTPKRLWYGAHVEATK